MARMWIVVGDTTTSGGTVPETGSTIDIDGLPIARVGDKVICGRHGPTVIVSGDPTQIDDNKPWAREGDKCACGCALMSVRQRTVYVDAGGGGGNAGVGAADKVAAEAPQPRVAVTPVLLSDKPMICEACLRAAARSASPLVMR